MDWITCAAGVERIGAGALEDAHADRALPTR
jgi:hypothetical protein